MNSFPSVAVIIVNWNNYRDTARCLVSLEELDYPEYEIILVDNGSSDGSGKEIAREFPEIRLIKARENRGFAAGNNLALKIVLDQGYDFVLLLNNDTEIINPGFLWDLVGEAGSSRVGAVAPQVQLPDGTIQDTILPYPRLGVTIWNSLGFYHSRLNKKQDVDSLSGCCVLVKTRAVKEAGLLDENFFMYGEETEWFFRIRKAGWIVRFIPVRSVLHHRGASSRKLDQIELYIERRANVIYTLTKHDMFLRAWLMKLFMMFLLVVRIVWWKLSGRLENNMKNISGYLKCYRQAIQEKIFLAKLSR